MPCQLLGDCLNDVFECLEDEADLRSCLLVNRLWCEVSVPILWTTIQNYRTLIACLPNESKETLQRNNIVISIPTSRSPSFHYGRFIKNLSMCRMGRNIKRILDDNDEFTVVVQEIFKMFMNQTCLKNLDMVYSWYGTRNDSSYIQH